MTLVIKNNNHYHYRRHRNHSYVRPSPIKIGFPLTDYGSCTLIFLYRTFDTDILYICKKPCSLLTID